MRDTAYVCVDMAEQKDECTYNYFIDDEVFITKTPLTVEEVNMLSNNLENQYKFYVKNSNSKISERNSL